MKLTQLTHDVYDLSLVMVYVYNLKMVIFPMDEFEVAQSQRVVTSRRLDEEPLPEILVEARGAMPEAYI